MTAEEWLAQLTTNDPTGGRKLKITTTGGIDNDLSDLTISDPAGGRKVKVTSTGGGGGVQSVVAGDGISVDNTDPDNPIISSNTLIDITKASFIGLFPGFDVDPKACYRITNAAQGVVRVYGVTTGTTTAAAFLEGSWDGSVLTDGAWGNYNVSTDTFTSISGLIQTITKVDFDAAIAANELVIGQQYLVTGAFTSTVFNGLPSWDVLCIAFSNNQVYGRAWANAGNGWNECNYDPSAPSVILANLEGLTISPTIADNWGAQTVEWVGMIPIIVDALGGGQYIKLQISSDPSTLIFTNALNTTTGEIGTYDPATDTFTPYPTIVSFTKTLTDTQIKAGGYFDIDEMPSVSGAYWQFCECFAVLAGQTTPYDGVGPTLSLWIDGADDAQIEDTNNILSSGNGDGSTYLTPKQTFNTLKEGKGQVYIKTSSPNGDGTLTVYGTARLVTI